MYVTKSDYVYEELKKKILNNELVNGQRLVVSDLTKMLNVSPMPIREALIRLQEEEFLENIPHVGVRVISKNADKRSELSQIRIDLETFASRLLAPVITEEQLAVLDNALEVGLKFLKAQDPHDGYFAWNKEFHLSVASMNPNSVLYEYILSTWQKASVYGGRIGVHNWRIEESYNEHVLWVNALREHDAEKAAKLCWTHCSSVSEVHIAEYI